MTPPWARHQHQQQRTPSLADLLPFLPQREPSGLDTLAEVSRQLQANGVIASDDAFAAQLQQHMEESDTYSVGDQAHSGARVAASASDTPATTPPNFGDDGSGLLHATSAHNDTNGPLIHAASAANEQLAEAAVQQSHPQAMQDAQSHPQVMQDVQSHSQAVQDAQPHPQVLQDAQPPRARKRKASGPVPAPDPSVPNEFLSYYPQHAPPAIDQHDHLQHSSSDFQTIPAPFRTERDHQADDTSPAFTMNTAGFGVLQRPNRIKARGRFTEERRKEVQSVRKKGACLRCRMLKKPCSEGTPCLTCSGIESARLWKGACIRTRVADEFGLYSTAYFYNKDRAVVYASLNERDPLSVVGRIEVTLFPNDKLYATFPALKTDRAGRLTDGLDPHFLSRHPSPDEDETDIFLLSFKSEETLALKLERYIYAAIAQIISSEPAPIIRSTLELAAELNLKQDDTLMTNIIRLWAATNLLITQKPLWTISYNPKDSPIVDHITIVDEKTDQGRNSVDCREEERLHFASDSPHYRIMHAQLQDAAERYCQKHAKMCLNELEKRLLQRQQSESFPTFLAAVILLNCVERMTALYYSFDPLASSAPNTPDTSETKSAPGTHNENKPSPEETKSDRTSGWPIPDPPSRFWPQGHTFASLLQLLLRMRGLPPSIHIRDDGSLAILSNFNKAYPVEVSANNDGGDSQQRLAAQWISRTGLRARELFRVHGLSDAQADKEAWGERKNDERDGDQVAREQRAEGENKGARAWDLRFVAPLLLPQMDG